MEIDLRLLSATPEVTRYGQALAQALQASAVEVNLARSIRPWWEPQHGTAIGIGPPTNSRRIQGWIWLGGSVEAALALKRDRPDLALAVAAIYPPAPPDLSVVPFPIPDVFFAPGDGETVFQVTRQLHLEQRPRIVMMGPLVDGRGLTQAMTAMVHVLASGGELAILDGLSIRSQFAPVIQRLGLVDKVVFLPPLEDSQTAAVLLGADLAMLPERTRNFPYWIPWCHAAGLPVVALDTKEARLAVGTAALLVDPDRDDGLENAIREALTNEATRRHLIARGMVEAQRGRSMEVAKAFLAWIHTMESAE